ncbi:hypothetical protein L1987_51065 [Smallanthus sonchifolius]|uniref:Uncharacterized protein n=1 Tax=Smallanthus sonchifolius TaxID=185202 RepID=A0ACB9EPA6_9ASTR|nr:hypothetical protein L1987_51065 [Smallanthus sonchifolius]
MPRPSCNKRTPAGRAYSGRRSTTRRQRRTPGFRPVIPGGFKHPIFSGQIMASRHPRLLPRFIGGLPRLRLSSTVVRLCDEMLRECVWKAKDINEWC